MQKITVSVPFMLLGILFNVCLVAANLLETKVIQFAGVTATAGLIVDYLEWFCFQFFGYCFRTNCNSFTCSSILEWRRSLQFRIWFSSSYCDSQFTCLFGRFFS